MSDLETRALARRAETGSVVDIERLYSARARSGEIKDARTFIANAVVGSEQRRLTGLAMGDALQDLARTGHGIGWRLIATAPMVVARQADASGYSRPVAVIDPGLRRFAFAVVLREGMRVPKIQTRRWLWDREDVLVLGVKSCEGRERGLNVDQPPSVAWPALSSSPHSHTGWTFSPKPGHFGEPSGPQIERCRRWANLAVEEPFSQLAEDRVAIPLAFARVLAERLSREGTLFA